MKRTSFMPPNGCSPTVPLDPVQSAKAADLRYVSDAKPGIRRVKAGKHFRYVDPAGVPVRDPEVLARIRCLVIPPAWTDVWICPIANGHLQATGRDARGRKQYQYHPRWREVRDLTKYGRMVAFGGKLPRIRRRVRSDLRVPRLPREKVLATVVRLLELTCMRVGNEEYARTNNSYGITTLRDRHARIAGPILEFRFRGKRGKEHVVRVTDRRLARIVKRCQDIPGYELFQYIDESGNRQSIDSEDVNSYLRMITGEDFTAKDFRTWAGTVQAAVALRDIGPATSVSKAKKNVVQAIQTVAELLGNTPAICRKCYIHPGVIDSYMQGTLLDRLLNGEADAGPRAGLTKDERVVLAFLRAAPARAAGTFQREMRGRCGIFRVFLSSFNCYHRAMKALVKKDAKPGLWLEDVPEPKIGINDVLISVDRTGICGTDLHVFEWDAWAQRTIPVPITVGHEFVGEIVEVGSNVGDFRPGDIVSAEGHVVCGRCRNCLAGRRHLCKDTRGIGVTRPGAFAELISVPVTNVWHHKDGIDRDVASIFDPFGNAVHTALTFDVLGEDVLITGAGPIGMMAAAVVRHAGARFVVITDVNEYRLELARQMGVTVALNVRSARIRDIQQELGMKEGFDVGLEMSGNQEAFGDMIDNMCHGGKIAMLGIPSESITIDWNKVIFNMLTIKGIYGREMYETWYKMTVMLETGLDIKPVITHRFHFEEFLKGFEVMKTGQSGKVILEWK